MPIDARIPLMAGQIGLASPMERQGRVMSLANLLQQQQMGAMQMQDAMAAREREASLRSLLSQGDVTEDKLLKGGHFDAALKFGKEQRERAKTTAETASANALADERRFKIDRDRFAFHVQQLSGVNDPAGAQQWIAGGLQSGLIDEQQAQAALQAVPQDPQGFAAWKQTQMMRGVELAKQFELAGQEAQRAETAKHHRATEAGQEAQRAEAARHNRRQEGISADNLKVAQDRLKLDGSAPKGIPTVTDSGVVLVDPRSGTARPVTGADGKPIQGKQPEAVRKEIVSLDQQNAIVDGAIEAVKKTPTAFSFSRGLATMGGPITETVAGRFDSDAERQARSYVFNNVSAVINERAGAAQSVQELARLRSFLPADADNAEQVVSKLNAFKAYIADKRAATVPGAAPGKVVDFSSLK